MFGDTTNFEKGLFEHKLKREIQLFNYTNAKDVKQEINPTLTPNIVKGINIKQSIEPFEVTIHA